MRIPACLTQLDFNDHEDQVQSCSWKGNGSLLATTAKDKSIRVLDPRSKSVACQVSDRNRPSFISEMCICKYSITARSHSFKVQREIQICVYF